MMNQSIVQEEKELLQDIVEHSHPKKDTPINTLITKIEEEINQLEDQVGASLHLVKPNIKGQITIVDLRLALQTIKHPIYGKSADALIDKFDVDQDGLVSIEEMEKQLNLTIQNK